MKCFVNSNKKKSSQKAFTLAEAMICFVVISIIAVFWIGIMRSNKAFNVRMMYYATLKNLGDVAQNMVVDGYVSGGTRVFELPTAGFCASITQYLNVVGTTTCANTATTANFVKGGNPQPSFTLSNGSVFYNVNSYNATKKYYDVFVDVNGNDGDHVFNQDVFEFYITLSGHVYPATTTYAAAANNITFLSAGVTHRNATTAEREYVAGSENKSYMSALCASNTVEDALYSTLCTSYGLSKDTTNCSQGTSGNTCKIKVHQPGYEHN